MDTVEVVCTAAESINLAFYQNAIPIIRELFVSNATGAGDPAPLRPGGLGALLGEGGGHEG